MDSEAVAVTIFNDETQKEEELTPSAKWEQGDPPIVYKNPGNVLDGSFVNRQGLRIETFSWLVDSQEQVRGDVVVTHGLGTHTRYTYLSHVDYDDAFPHFHEPQIKGSFVEAMLAGGFNVHGFDFQSYGQSEGVDELRGYFLSYDDHVADLKQFCEYVKEQYNSERIFLVGSSAGGLISARFAQVEPDMIDGCILYAPALSIDEILDRPTNKIMLPVANCLARMLPTARLGSYSPNLVFPHEQAYIKHDPLCDRLAFRLWPGLQTLSFVPQTADDASKITAPLLVFHSIHDTTCDIAGTVKFFDAVSSTDKQLIRLQTRDSWHSLLVEPCRDEVVNDSLQWLLARS